MSYADWSNNKKKKKYNSYADWSNAKHGISKAEQDSALAWRDDEIAPVKKTQSDGWFQKGALGNGLSWKNAGKTAGGTVADVAGDAVKGGGSLLERLWDGMLMLGAAMNEGTMNEAANNEMIFNAVTGKGDTGVLERYQKAQDEVEKATMEAVAKNTIDEEKIAKTIIDTPMKKIGVDVEADSVLGQKSDALVQSGTDVLIRQGISKIPVVGQTLGYAVTGLSVMGGEAENAAREGASYDDALLSGILSAGAEIGTEAMFGGIKIGDKAWFDDVVGKVVKKIPSKFVSTLAKWGINTAGEGAEEAISGWLQAGGQKLTYKSEAELNELYNWGDAWEDFVSGAVLGGLFEGVHIASANKHNIDYVTELNKNEKAVIDKVYKDAIAEAEKGGKKLTAKEKTKIFDNIVENAEKGYISTDTIEEVLGGEDYKAYKEVADVAEGMTKEYTELGNKERFTLADQYKYQTLAERLKTTNAKKDAAKAKLDETMQGLIQNSHLVESYNEKARKGQAFVADLSQYDEKQRAAVERAIKSGVLNNTNRSHDLVNALSKIEADKGIVFDYANNAKLKESGFAIEGKTVNGFANKSTGTVTLNIQSAKAWQSTVGHEIGHVLKGTDSFEALQETLFKYAESKGELASRKAALTELYKDIDTDIDEELTCDLIGDYLFSDSNFIKNLTTDKNLFQKVWDEVKYMCKVATGKQLTEIEKVEREFAKVWKEFSTEGIDKAIAKGTDAKVDDVRLSVSEESKVNSTYSKAVESGNTEIAQKILDETAKKAGYDIKAYHGTGYDFTVFDKSKQGDNYQDWGRLGKGFYFAPTSREAETWAELSKGGKNKVMPVYLRSENMLDSFEALPDNLKDTIPENWDSLTRRLAEKYAYNYIEYMQEFGYNVQEILTQKGYDGINGHTEFVVFDPEQVKSADPVTYDNNGNVIPLSQRFNKTNDDIRYSVSDIDGNPIDAERISNDEFDVKYSISHNADIAKGQSEYINKKNVHITADELEEAQRITNAMVDVMMKYSTILPEDKIGKVLTKNGSYDRSVENTTICIRTLAYNEFVDKVQEEIGRPLTQMESFLVSQKLYDIATDPQCLYCYVSLDRKAFNDMLLRYMQDRDTVIVKYNNSDKSPKAINKLYEEFLNGRKDTENMKERFNNWLNYVDNGTQLLSLADIATEERQSVINADGGILAEQLKDARAYAQSASWSKIQKNYVAYRDEILKLGDGVVKNLNKHYGLRWYSFSDYSPAFIVENMQQITDASIRGLKGLSYTKDTDFAEIFAPSGMNINVSVFVNQDANGNFFIDEKQSANFEKALALREQYPNVGIVATVTNDEALRWAGEQEWSDVIIPFHIVRTGTDVAEYYKWLNYTAESADTVGDKDLWNAYVDSLNLKSENARKKVSKNIYPSEHKNDKTTYLGLCESRGLTPRFARFAGEDWYMKLVNETRLSADNSSALKPNYNLDAAKTSFQKFVDKGGYEGGWYKDGINVDDEVKIVAEDVLAGKKANEVDYGRQDGFVPEDLIANRKTNRKHGQLSLSYEGEDIAPVGTPLKDLYLAPTKETAADNATFDAPYIAPITEAEANAIADENFERLVNAEAPPEVESAYYEDTDTTAIDDKTLKGIGKTLRDTLSLTAEETRAIQEIVQEYSTSETANADNLFDVIKEKFGEKVWKIKNEDIAEVKRFLKTTKISVSPKIKSNIADYSDFRKNIGGKLGISKDGLPVDTAYQQLVEMYPAFFSEDISNETDQFLRMVEVASTNLYETESQQLDDATIEQAVNIISNEVTAYKQNLTRMAAEDTAREALDSIAPLKAEQIMDGSRGDALLNQSLDNYPIKTVEDRVAEKLRAVEAELTDNRHLRREAEANYNKQIADAEAQYAALKDKNTKKANNLVQRVLRLEKLKASVDAEYAKRISDLEARVEKMNDPKYSRAMNKQEKMQQHAEFAANLLGDTSTWVDKKIGLQYSTNTERRNLRDIVRDANGNADIAKADAIDDALNGQYNREEAAKKRELAKIRGKYAELKITKAEDTYIQMLGELRSNPDTTLTEKVVNEFYEKHKNKIDKAKVEKVLEYARQDYDSLLKRVNEVLKSQGMKEIPYRQGYFPHFTEPKQNFIQKLLNWKTQDTEIPTSIAGLTEDFKPVKKYQSFDKQRHGDTTDYSFTKGFDTYSDGALDWVYHLETLQKRRAVENHIRSTHSDEGIQARIKEVYANEELDANEAQAQIEHILAEAKNPLNNFVQDFTTHTNILAGKKNSLDRTVEQATNRKIYSVMTNVQNRMSANMVLANVRSALTNFIPITQSWAQVSPLRSLQATKDTIANAIKDDGVIDKSTFLTNRLREVDNLYQTGWDKVIDKAGIMFEIVDNFSSQVIWRSKYNQNLANGMTEAQAIKNADQFAENVMAGRSKGNEPTLFNAKNPLVKAFTMFQLEVNNQYGYLFKDVPNDLKAETEHWKFNLAKGYTTAFVGAYIYNTLLEQVAGSGAALDPIGIIEDLLRDLGLLGEDDEEEEKSTAFLNLAKNVGEELPFVGNLLGGGRIPISSAVPYSGEGFMKGLETFAEDVGNIGNGGGKNILKEAMNPILNVGLPVGGGQLKKTIQGLSMFNTDEDHPIAGSYTDSGSLRFPVEDTFGNRLQAGIFGQYASKNARTYFDNGYAPLKEKQIQEYTDVDLPIADYWKYREGLKGLKTNAEKADYINSLDIQDWQKNLLMNNILDRKEDVDMSNYGDYGSFEEFDYAQKNPEKYAVSKVAGGYSSYKTYSSELYDIKADKDSNGKSINGSRKNKVIEYINNLDADYETKIILYKSEYPSDDTYNNEIVNYINNRNDLTYDERIAIFTELGFIVKDGYVYWD